MFLSRTRLPANSGKPIQSENLCYAMLPVISSFHLLQSTVSRPNLQHPCLTLEVQHLGWQGALPHDSILKCNQWNRKNGISYLSRVSKTPSN